MSTSELDRAIEANDLEQVKRLVEAGADLTQMGDYDSTPLANAAALGRLEIVKYLLEIGAAPELGGCRSTIGIACGRGYYDVCKALLDAGADPNEGDIEGGNCLGMAIFKARLGILKLLVERGATYEPLDEYIDYATQLNQNGSHDEVIAYLRQLEKRPISG
jgi:ankyrin repeat protein